MNFSVEEAKRYSKMGKLEECVHKFLSSEGGNQDFLEMLKQQKRYWAGPIKYDLKKLRRITGPTKQYKYYEPKDNWEKRVKNLQKAVRNGWESPPFIVQNNKGVLLVSDGNHRLEAFIRERIKEYWVIIWNNESKNKI